MAAIHHAREPLRPARSRVPQIRCARCGTRAPREHSGCPNHLPLPATPSPPEARPESDEAPVIPGFRALRKIGQGGYGVVFEAEGETGERAAIKIARVGEPLAALRLRREARALNEIGPPWAPALLATGELSTGAPYLVMDHLRAPTLADRLAESAGPTPPAEALAIARGILTALGEVHRRGLIHGDLKPENIFVDNEARATLIDFGLATSVNATSWEEETTPAEAAGTAEYMSPEQCAGQGDLDPRTDIYAVGVLLFEMLAGRPPFWGSRATVLESHRSRRPPQLAALVSLPAGACAVVMRSIAKDRRDRFQHADDMLTALDEVLADQSSEPFAFMSAPSTRASVIDASTPLSSSRERRRVAVVSFETSEETARVHRRVLLLGGQLAHAEGSRCVSLFGHQVGDHPARRALRAAHDLIKQGICDRAAVDLIPIVIQTRKDGSKRFLSPLFSKADRFPSEADPAGVFLSQAAAETLPGVEGVVLARRGWIHLGGVRGRGGADDPKESAPLFGRGPLLAELIEGARRAITQRRPCVVGVVADEGLGKSRLAAEILAQIRAELPSASILELKAREPLADRERSLTVALLAQALELPASPPSDGGRALLRERLGPTCGADRLAAVAFALEWIGADDPDLAALLAAPGALRGALAVATGEALRQRASAYPMAIVLDDAHFADDAALDALEYAALEEAGAPIWICALGRPGFEAARPSWGDRAAERSRRRLDPLDEGAAADLCRSLLLPASDVPDAAIRRLVEWTQGSPLLLVELARALMRDGIVRRSPQGGSYYLAADELDRAADLPFVEWTAHREIDALTPALRAHAGLLSLLGPAIEAVDVESIVARLDRQGGVHEMTLDAGVGTQRLLSLGVLARDDAGRTWFRRELVREALARSIPAPIAARIHRAAFEHYSDAAGMPERARLAHIARHAAFAGDPSAAASAYLALAGAASAEHRYLDAELLYGRSLALPVEPSLDVYRGRGLMRYRLGRYHDALSDFARARELAEARGDGAQIIEILLDEATALDWMGDRAASAERSDRAWALSGAGCSPALAARLLLSAGRTAHRAGDRRKAAGLLREAADEASALGDEAYETKVISFILLGFILQHLSDGASGAELDEAGRALDRAIALCEEHGDRLHLGPAIANRALLRGYRGDAEGMSADYARLLALGRELGQVALEIVGHYNLGEHLYYRADLGASEVHIQRALAADARGSGGEPRSLVRLLEARLRLYKKDISGALAIARSIREREAERRAAGRTGGELSPSEDVLRVMVELSERDPFDPAWDELVARSSRCSVGQEHIEVLEARALCALRASRVDLARRLFMSAAEAAERIPNVIKDRVRRAIDELPP